MLGLQNGEKRGASKTDSSDYFGQENAAKADADERLTQPSPRYDCASALLERHEQLVNKVKRKK
ncbi:MAG: hypothetical protein ACI4VK_01135 [Candidatus Coproplasma sp.]